MVILFDFGNFQRECIVNKTGTHQCTQKLEVDPPTPYPPQRKNIKKLM